MAVRASMNDLISRTRQMIRDTAGTPFFDSQEVQDVLDEHRFTVRYRPLRPGPTLTTGALYDYLDYYSDVGNWESDAQLSWVDFSVITPTTSELIAGHWVLPNTFASGYYPPVRITGKFYDLYAGAADLLERRIASLALTDSFNATVDGTTFYKNQIITTLQSLVSQYRMKQMALSHHARRADVSPEYAPPLSISEGGPGDVG